MIALRRLRDRARAWMDALDERFAYDPLDEAYDPMDEAGRF